MDKDEIIGTIHRAGPLIAGVQKCSDCGGVLCNYRGAMVQEGDSLPGGWEEGENVTVWGKLEGTCSSAVGVHQPAFRCENVPN